MSVYIGVNDTAKKVSDIFVGVDNVAKKVKKGYVGDANNIARLFYSSAKTFTIRLKQVEHCTITATYGEQTFTGNVDISGFPYGATVHITITADAYYMPDTCYIAYGSSELETPYSISNVSYSGQNLTFDVIGYDTIIQLTPAVEEALPDPTNYNFAGTTYASVVMFESTELAQWYINKFGVIYWGDYYVSPWFVYNLTSMSQFGSWCGRPILLLSRSYYEEIIGPGLDSYNPKTLIPSCVATDTWMDGMGTLLADSAYFVTHTDGYGYVIPGSYEYHVASYDSTYNVRIEVIAPNTWMFKLVAK